MCATGRFRPWRQHMSPACESSPECCAVSKRPDLWEAPGAEITSTRTRKTCRNNKRRRRKSDVGEGKEEGAEGRADDGWGGASVSEGSAIVGPVNLPGRDLGNPLARPGQLAERSRSGGAATNCRSQLIAQGYPSTRVVCTRFFGPVEDLTTCFLPKFRMARAVR